MVWPILRRPSRRVPPLVVADVALDVETGWLSVGGWTVRLTSREVQLLEQLMRQPGRVVGDDELASILQVDASHLARSARRLRRRLEWSTAGSTAPRAGERTEPRAAWRAIVLGWPNGRTPRRLASRLDGPPALRRGAGHGRRAVPRYRRRRRPRLMDRCPSTGLLAGPSPSLPRRCSGILPGWRWEGRSQRRWEARFAALNRYLAEHGLTTPPSNALSGKLRVGEWAAKQRRAHAAGTLPTPLVEKLESLPGWRWHGDDRWRRGFGAVRDYLAQHTTLESVDHVEIDGFALGNWVQRCREDYRSGTLSHAQIDDLESLPGWTWSGPDERWRQGFAALRAYYVRYGSARPPQKTVITGFALGQWVHPPPSRLPTGNPQPRPGSRARSHCRPGRGPSSPGARSPEPTGVVNDTPSTEDTPSTG